MPMSHTVDQVGKETISIITTGHEKSNFTCVLSITASSEKLPPMIIFKRKTLPKEKFPSGIVVRVNPKGWMDSTMMHQWLINCYRKRADGFFRSKKALLIMDSMRAHITDDVKQKIYAENTFPLIIPGGVTKCGGPTRHNRRRIPKLKIKNFSSINPKSSFLKSQISNLKSNIQSQSLQRSSKHLFIPSIVCVINIETL